MFRSKKSGFFILVAGLLIYLVGAFYLNDTQVVIFGVAIALSGVIINLIILFKVLRGRK